MNTVTFVPSVEDESDILPITAQQTTNFYYSFSFLPKEEREAIFSVYNFCRYTDDIVDENYGISGKHEQYDIVQIKRERLHRWRRELERCYDGSSQHPILKPLSPVIQRFAIPEQYFMILIDGCERDLVQTRYETFAELKEYCYSVASIVGLMSIEIFGYKYDETKEYAINLGYALQLTNILRDFPADFSDKDRIYLPLEDLDKFHYSEADLRAKRYNEQFIELMRFQTRRAREYYHKARAALRPDESSTLFAAEIMDAIYYRLLEKIEMAEYNVFQKRISVSSLHKVLIALRLWTKSHILLRK